MVRQEEEWTKKLLLPLLSTVVQEEIVEMSL